MDGERRAGVQLPKCLGGYVETGDDAVALRHDDTARPQRRFDRRLGGDVAGAEILLERAVKRVAVRFSRQRC